LELQVNVLIEAWQTLTAGKDTTPSSNIKPYVPQIEKCQFEFA